MKLLMSADPIGGVWQYALDLAAGLHEYDIHVVLATLGTPLSPLQRREVQATSNVTLVESAYKLEWMPEPWSDLEEAGNWLLELAEQYEVDLVHLNHLVHAALPFRVPGLTVVHSCLLSWWEHVLGTRVPDRYGEYQRRVAQSLAAADAVITLTHSMADAVQRHYGPLADVAIINNARRPAPSTTVVREPRIFTAGRVWDAAKNVAAVVRVAPAIGWPVCVAGATEAPDGTGVDGDSYVHANAFSEQSLVHFTGMLGPSEMERCFATSSVYALPARYEPFGLTILEAARAGCSLVLGDIPSLRELWDGAALFVNPNDDAALRDALRRLTTDESQRAVMSRRAQRRAGHFSFDRFVREYVVAYRTLSSSGGGLFEGIRLAPSR